MRAPFVIYADLECLLEKMHSCQNNPEKSYTDKKIEHTLYWLLIVYKLFIWWNKNQLDCCKGENCMGRFCKDLREHAVKIINFEEKEMIMLTENKLYEKQNVCYICK